jgi:hypothetical protein
VLTAVPPEVEMLILPEEVFTGTEDARLVEVDELAGCGVTLKLTAFCAAVVLKFVPVTVIEVP